uniref:Mitochondrial phosphate carrier protein n=1 Tax=Megaselia scalaris TaxID=36166 RepID=T1GT48_MEGSC
SPFVHAECVKTKNLVHGREIQAAASGDSCEFGSMKYFLLCSIGGIMSCGSTHTFVVPLDLVKCRLQVDSAKYKNIGNGFKVTIAEEGYMGLTKGWGPTLMEFFADIALCPFEAAKVKIQTTPGFANSFREAVPKIMAEGGVGTFYKGLVPLWMRQIPYTMMKFACFERTVELLYAHVVPKPRSDCNKAEQLGVTFVAGYIAGVFCAVVSHPADVVVSKLNQAKGSTAMDVAKSLGFMGMWNGLTPRIIMIGTLTALQWFIYDGVKVALGIPRPPPPEMPASLRGK